MYGLVNRAIEDLITSTAGAETWDEIKVRAGHSGLQILDSHNYSDQVTYDLVAAASEVLNQPSAEILRAFGRHWILYTGREGWASLFDFTAQDFISFVQQLDEMHARVNTAMPEGRMPEFTLVQLERGYELTYLSERAGLGPMVMGILEGLAEQFGEHWQIEFSNTTTDRTEESQPIRFTLLESDSKSIVNDRDAA